MIRAAIISTASSLVLLMVSLLAALLISDQGVNAARFANRSTGTITCVYWHPFGGFWRRRDGTPMEHCNMFEDRHPPGA